MLERSIAAPSVVAAIVVASRHGLDAQALWRLAGLDPKGAHGPADRVLESRLYAVFAAIMRGLGDPAFPIHYATSLTVDSYEVLGWACKTAPTVRAAFERSTRYHRFWTDTSAWILEETVGPPRWIFERQGERQLGMRAANEAAVAEMVQSIRGILPGFDPLRVSFRHTRPAATEVHDEFFAAPVEFEASFDGMELPDGFLDQQNPKADEAISGFFVDLLDQRLAQLDSAPHLEAQLVRIIGAALSGGVPRLATVARGLGMSERTLSRRLADQGTTYADVVERTRRRLAERMLTHTDHRVGEVAFLLGFSEASAFSRAFKRWTGASPARYRDESRDGGRADA